MKKLVATLCLLFMSLCASFAQEGTYVVTKKAKDIPVLNYDSVVIGHLHRGDKVYVTMFHQTPPQVNPNAVYPPMTTIAYRGEMGILYLKSPDWMRCESDVLETPEDKVATYPFGIADRSYLLWIVASYILLFFLLSKPQNLFFYISRKLPPSDLLSFGLSLLFFAVVGLEINYFLTAESPFWFCSWSEVGFLLAIPGIAAAIVMLRIKHIVLQLIVYRFANMSKDNPYFFSFNRVATVTFIGTSLALFVCQWELELQNPLLLAIAAAVIGYVIYGSRYLFRARGIFSGIIAVLLILVGMATLCYVALNVFAMLLAIVIIGYTVYFCLSALGDSSSKTESDSGPVNYFDPESGQMHQLYKDGSSYKDYSDGSVWTPGSDDRAFNRMQ